MEENKQVRVDNWGVFFLQRLQLFFNKTDYCDLTLQFHGNVQLKVHRLVLNACTEYFELLEHSDRLIDDNVILMPESLQADVVVPIINFMYTGMLEYPLSIYHRLCQAADVMHISVLTKLLDAQKQSLALKMEKVTTKPKVKETKSETSFPSFTPVKKVSPKLISSDLPSPSPGRKLTGWKRKSIPASSNSSFFSRSDSTRNSDPLALDNAKPTRFEWPEDDLELPNMDMMDISGFGDISYNSKPLLREEEVKPIIAKSDALKKSSRDEIHEIQLDDKPNHESNRNGTDKRKADTIIDKSPKKIRIVENEKDTTISVIANDNSPNFDPTKIVSEILKKYPHLVKKKKNIKLKIVSKHPEKESPKASSSLEKTSDRSQVKTVAKKTPVFKPEPAKSVTKDSVWTCKECTGEPQEFMLYYLYRKHMTDVHNMKFDPRICKYCGIAFSRNENQAYHSFTKHGRKIGNHVFPSCPQCPFVALSKEALQIHRNKHKKTEMQCTCCKLAFISPEAISGHIQITGHMGKAKKINVFDCQYCTKTSQSAISLLCHIKSNHETEGKRDGIVSLDEVDLEEGDVLLDDPVEEPEVEEYVVPVAQKNKVKIISDVTVPVSSKSKTTAENVTLDQTKSHVTVPTSIATSLGLLDIVVLDENQQFILHNQAEQTENNQTEYILPQIAPGNVTADGLPSNDELVMVLTDQDYKDGHSGITADNSNIVVLYSHPADGQQGQFITSQGNLMVNSETGMLEIRNGAAIATTSANQIVMSTPAENHIETIEMIQREIEEGQELKQESFYEEKPKVAEIQEQEPVQYIETPQIEIQSQPSMEVEVSENSDIPIEEDITKTKTEEVTDEQVSENLQTSNETEEEQTLNTTSIEEIETVNTTVESDKSIEAYNPTEAAIELKDPVPMEIEDTSMVEECPTSPKEDIPSSEANEEVVINTEETKDEQIPQEEADVSMEVDELKTEIQEEEKTLASDDNKVEEPTESDSSKNIENAEEQSQEPAEKDEEKPYSPTDNPIDMECEAEPDVKQETESLNENSIEITQIEKESESQENTESSQIEEDTRDKLSEDTKESTTMSILDDWEDTDSQQSDNKTKAIKKGAQETVHKLMDDWDEEEVEK